MKSEIDHIDPKWEEGRDYQLVCGLNVVYNMCERDPSINRSKGNRFIPWRWSRDDMGEKPVEQGDLCLFLDYNTQQWVLEEFMGAWWWEQSLLWGYSNTKPCSNETKKKIQKALTGRKGRKWTEEYRQKVIPRMCGKPRTETQINAITKYANEKWMCLRTGIVSNYAGLCRFQRSVGVPKDYRARVEDNPIPEFDLMSLVKEVKSRPFREGALTALAQSLGIPRTVIYKLSRKVGK